jgi:hypothetical protein
MTLRRPTELRAPTPTAADSAAFRGRPETAAPDRIEITTALLIVAIALVPVTWGTVLWAAPRGDADFNRRVTVQLFDFALALAACPTLATFVARPQVVAEHWRRWTVRRNAMLGTVILLLALGVLAFVQHPSLRGVELGVRLLFGGLAGHAILTAPDIWIARVRIAVTAAACVQAALAILQSAHGGPLGLRWLEFDGPLYPFGSSFAGRGGLTHPYHLAFVLELGIVAALLSIRHAARPIAWLVALATCAAGLGVTYSRAAAVGIVAAAIALLWPRHSRHAARAEEARRDRHWSRLAALALVLGAAATGLTMGDGWYTRTSGSTSVAAADSGRVERAREALELVEDHPLTGVGPGRYTIALADRGDLAPLPAHNFVLHVAAEAGVLAGVAVLGAALLLVRRYLLASPAVAASFVLVVPYFVFDAYPYVFPIGLFLTAVWLGLLERARTR